MKRSKYDPPEYQSWAPETAVVETIEPERLLSLYEGMVRFRLFDTMLKRWVKQGAITKAWLGTGEEAVSVGCTAALEAGDTIGPMIRNAGACFQMGMSLVDHFAAYLGTTESATGGRDLHVGDLEHGVIAPISHVGSLLPVMCGLALAYKLRKQPRVAMTWVGDGASRTGEIHEAINFAAVEKLPIVVIVQNNQVALGTHTSGESVAPYADWVRGYGIDVVDVDGNNVLDVFAGAHRAVAMCRDGEGPAALVAHTFRMGGHATHDEAEARHLFSDDVFAQWGARDPIGNYEEWLIENGHVGTGRSKKKRAESGRAKLAEIEARVDEEIEAAASSALAGRSSKEPDPSTVADGVYAGA